MSTKPTIFKSLEEARATLAGTGDVMAGEGIGRGLTTLEAQYREITSLKASNADLEAWKTSAVAAVSGFDLQAFGEEIQAEIDDSIGDKILVELQKRRKEIAELRADADADAHRLGDARREIDRLEARVRESAVAYLRILSDHDDLAERLETANLAIDVGLMNETRLKAALGQAPCAERLPFTPDGDFRINVKLLMRPDCGQCLSCKARAAQAKASESIGVEEACRVLNGGRITPPPSVKTTSGTGDDR